MKSVAKKAYFAATNVKNFSRLSAANRSGLLPPKLQGSTQKGCLRHILLEIVYSSDELIQRHFQWSGYVQCLCATGMHGLDVCKLQLFPCGKQLVNFLDIYSCFPQSPCLPLCPVPPPSLPSCNEVGSPAPLCCRVKICTLFHL